MIEVTVPKDIREYEPTLIGPLTSRTFVCSIIMVLLVYGVYLLEKAIGIEDPMEVPLFLIFGIPPFLIGWYKPYGMHFEKFIGKAFRDNFLAPRNRPYRIENMWDSIIEKEEKETATELRKTEQCSTPQRKKVDRDTSRSVLSDELKAYR